MAHWDEQLGMPQTVAAIPLLVLPMVVGAAVLLIWPDASTGSAAIIFSTVAVAWYLLGGAISIMRFARRFGMRRALSAIRADVAAAPEPIWLCDTDGRVVFANAAALDMGTAQLGSITEILARMRADALAAVDCLVQRAARLGTAEMDLGDGNAISLTCAQDAPLRIWAYHSKDMIAPDLPEETATATTEDLEGLPVALLWIAADGRVVKANSTARSLLQSRLPDPLASGFSMAELFDGPGRPILDWLADARAGRLDRASEILRLRHPEGRNAGPRDRHFQVALAYDRAIAGALVAVLTDISPMKTLEAQIVQSQKMQAIGQLAGGVAHDFNNLLTAIRGHCDLLMLRRDKCDPDFADLDQISQNTNRAAALVGQLLAFSRKQTLKLETLDLRDTLADLTHLLNRLVGERVVLTITHDPNLRPIRADKRQLEQVIMNLVVNARDAMPQGGEILVRTENMTLQEALHRDRAALPAGDYVRISVADQGCGIAPDNLAKIFEPFFTTKRTGEGTGLGLSTAYGIIKQTGGYIFCDSVLGQGTQFSIYLPAQAVALDRADAPTVEARIAPRLDASRKRRILLVEDEAPVRAFAARALKLKGHEVLEAESGEAALELLTDSDVMVDLLLTDVVMPGLDGPSWVREARLTRPSVGVIFMSGYTEDIFADGGSPLEKSAFLPKPFSLYELTCLVEECLRDNFMQLDATDGAGVITMGAGTRPH
ncbi:MAG: ATP-binding protein [Paracoccus sp. (in: a-proteobacteria)]|nr:ATP-binding protein [Paracoccus sp. (in: a-proteobacteria)]